MDIKKEYERWLENATADANVAAELKTLDNAKIEDAQCYNINDNVILWTTVRKNLRIMKELYSLI